MPRCQHASYGGQTVTLENKHLRLDTHNSTTGNYGGAAIPPDVIAINLMGL
jgi:hypothetical protein